jgi:glycosyltransferase involved in cell wall biosynthesis
VGQVPEILQNGKNGLLVSPGNSDELSNAIMRLLKSEELRREFTRVGRKLVETKYDWAIIAKRLLQVYEKVLASR